MNQHKNYEANSLNSNKVLRFLRPLIDDSKQNNDSVYFQYRFRVDHCALLTYLKNNAPVNGKLAYWDLPKENFSFLALGDVAEWTANGPQRFAGTGRRLEQLQSRLSILNESTATTQMPAILFFSSFFHQIAQDSEWDGFSPAKLYLPEILIAKDGETVTICLNYEITGNTNPDSLLSDIQQQEDAFRAFSASTDFSLTDSVVELAPYLNGEKPQWIRAVNRSISSIKDHEIDKVVLAKKSEIDVVSTAPLYDTLRNLRSIYPGCVTFLFREANGKAFFGATPEWLARMHDGILTCDALAGSIGRSENPSVDRQLGQELLESRKNRSEHDFVVQYLENKMQHLADDTRSQDAPTLKKLYNVQHLYTKMTGRLKSGVSPMQVVEQLHPTPAVGGIPSETALDFIRKVEELERGYYAAPMGWISADGDFDFAVGLRSGLLDSETLHLYAGAGIVEGSDPDDEYEELQLKLQPLLNAFQAAPVHE